ncbi:SUKH-3 domain containing protein [Streptomyces sp. AJS327]|uniref:SUKH-3 domain-containing protein n=1 Tax=Streptomyces sp. AJS327 TaxID=2545265 RepID=UPI0015DE39E4|nr:SUKH-3 domain-containing protein [Streptomyces sp. AJS327]MBA0049397.1 SUKH-3 domain containing protein [Streptomyces sp. AJS327]
MSTAGRHPGTTRFAAPVDDALRAAGWWPGRRDIRQAEVWADALRAHTTPAGHQHAVLASAVEIWAEFGTLPIVPSGPGREVAPTSVLIDPTPALHAARTLGDLGRALETDICPLGVEGVDGRGEALLAIDTAGRVYGVDPAGDWYLGPDFDAALTTLLLGERPHRLTPADRPGTLPAPEGARPE